MWLYFQAILSYLELLFIPEDDFVFYSTDLLAGVHEVEFMQEHLP